MTLGSLYNVKNGQSTGFSIFSKTVPESAISSRDENAINLKYIFSESYKEKFKALDINGHLKLSILAEIIDLNAQAKYLRSEKKSSTTVNVSLSYSVSTVLEKIEILSKEISALIDLTTLKNTDATHIVIGMQWGAHMLCSFEHHMKEGESKAEIEGELSSSFERLEFVGKAESTVKIRGTESTKETSVTVNIFGDIVPKAGVYPTSREDAIQFMRQVPELMKEVNQGKGNVLKYILVPIEQVREHFNLLEARIESVSNTVSLDMIDKVENIFDVIVENRLRLKESSDAILKYGDYITDREVRSIRNILQKFREGETTFKDRLSKAVREIQAGKNTDILSDLILDFEDECCSTSSVDEAINKYRGLKNRILFIGRCNAFNITVMSKKQTDIASVLSPSSSVTTHILMVPKSKDDTIEKSHEWESLRLLREDHNDGIYSKFFVYQASIMANEPMANEIKELKIVKYIGSLESNQEVCRPTIRLPTVKWSTIATASREERLALEGYPLRMPCPLSHEAHHHCDSSALEWVCFKCEQVLVYDYDRLVYCNCGKLSLKDCMFRCTMMTHGFKYHGLHDQSVQSIREKTKPGDDDINILLLGETGVGKSTFINAFANYLKYSSLEEAEKNEMMALIHSSFDIAGTKIVVGEDDKNERLTNGDSSTQKCRAYEFPYKDGKKIRFIDTPGIGDTRGVKQDRLNFQEILDFISGYDKINGICVLLLPDVARLTPSFRFCIDELLMHLHKSAKDNVLFTFTKTRATLYRAGETFTPLMTYIKELETRNGITIRLEPNTMYYFDNEAFKLYAALKQNIPFDDKTKRLFAESWTRSVGESRRLINRVMDLNPHRTEDTLTLDNARRSIFQLAEPMTKINEYIAIELEAIQVLKDLAKNQKITAQELKEKLTETYMDLNPINLARPRMVCTSDGCSTIQGNIVRYNNYCHENCTSGNIPFNALRTPGMILCSKMDFLTGDCKTCGCNWYKHKHVRIDYQEVKKQKTNPNVAEELQETELKAKSMQQEISKANKRVKTLQSEKKQIFDSLMIFTRFLLQNSIVQQNSGILDYIDMSIRNQERVAERSKDYSIVSSLKQQRMDYVTQKEVFENAKKEGTLHTGIITLEDVKRAKDALCRLENNGQALATVLKWGKENQVKATKRETEHVTVYNGSSDHEHRSTSAADSNQFRMIGGLPNEAGDSSHRGRTTNLRNLVSEFASPITFFSTRSSRND
ncbi:hypothetical protein BGZ99_006168 [Dissophora globulifera]|uniref:G domain-containing protein n=1 Tax=Dissophora globulifera TaxID=979702 RepID=A0A9P6USD8_9FUNG|nr:hypothetical protein BGZ99_006168 [Dissophora globulifera]